MKLLHIKTAKNFEGSDRTKLFIYITYYYISLAISDKLSPNEFKRKFYCKKEKRFIKVTDLTLSYIRFSLLYEGVAKVKEVILYYELTSISPRAKITFSHYFTEGIDYFGTTI